MDRRSVIAMAGALLAGCGDRRRGTATRTATRPVTPAPGPLHDFRVALRDRGIAVEYLAVEEGTVNLDYRTDAAARAALRSEVAWVADVFATVVLGGWRVRVLDATVLAGEDRLLATFRVDRAWVERYSQGEWATGSRWTRERDAFRRRVFATLETPHSPSSTSVTSQRGRSGPHG